MTIDTGASANIMDEETFRSVAEKMPIDLQPSSTQIFAYGSQSQLTVLGKFNEDIKIGDKSITTTIHVVEGAHGSLLSFATALASGVVDININAVSTGHHIAEKYPGLFEGIGKLKDFEVKLHIDESVAPVAQPARRIPFHLRRKVEAELQRLEQLGIIEPLEGPTHWVSPLVVIPKKKMVKYGCVSI